MSEPAELYKGPHSTRTRKKKDQNHFGADQNLCEKYYCDQANTKGEKGRICAADSLLVYYNNQHRQLELKVEI